MTSVLEFINCLDRNNVSVVFFVVVFSRLSNFNLDFVDEVVLNFPSVTNQTRCPGLYFVEICNIALFFEFIRIAIVVRQPEIVTLVETWRIVDVHNVPLHPEVICFEICFSVHRVHWMSDTTEVERSLTLRSCSSDAVVHTNRRVSLLLVAYRTLEVIDPELSRIRVLVDEDAVMTD